MNKYRIPPLPHCNEKHALRGAFFVSGVRGCDEKAAEHRKHTHVGMFLRFSMRGVVGELPDMKNTSRGRVFVSSVRE